MNVATSITVDEVKHLADLSRMELSDAEATHLASEIGSILGYVSQITEATGDMKKEVPGLRNVMREDVVTHEPRQYTEAIVTNIPSHEGDFLKVKKIL